MKIFTELPDQDRAVIDEVDGWKVKQYFNKKASRWYVTISANSLLARQWKRTRVLRSHYVYMRGNDVWEIGVGYVVHHIDFDSRNDIFANLARLTTADHDQLHKNYAALYGYPSTFKGRRHRPETIAKMREIAKGRGNNDIWDSPKTHHFENTKTLMSERALGEKNPVFRDDLDPVKINAFYQACRSLSETAAHFGCSTSAVRYRLDPTLYKRRRNPLTGRERTYRFDDAEMVAIYKSEGARAAAQKYGCSQATILYRVKTYNKEVHHEG